MKKSNPTTPNKSQKISTKYAGKPPITVAEKLQEYVSESRIDRSTNRTL
ncbi:hypothetical protein SAMN04489724_2491 [Algoriphagus locisalis]|uniref:Uncharacterized protein n=1 Tax=Algoriphagus locisalis TaxID=305507 RepID=A0A1I7BK80_9BACT|nr:hypothetical protein [Algoriphagus locisalis]SFT87575.1 hypothetical protein SAMN04489724_2491 [Algoriphagus locisalis]